MALTYCMNVHPGEQWADQVRATREDARRVRDLVGGGDAPFGLGLRISAAAAAELTAERALVSDYRSLLADLGMYAFTVNAFPYGTFHGVRVKDAVYEPDWSRGERFDYTLQVARVLAALLPEGEHGSISTAPLTFKGWAGWEQRETAALQRMAAAAYALWRLEADTGKRVVLAMEPEPGCYPETTPELVGTMLKLRELGGAHLEETFGVADDRAQEILRTYVGCCFDTAHQAVEFESLAGSIQDLAAADVAVAKVQVSAALEADCADPEAVAQLAAMQDEVYLHQVGLQLPDGSVKRWYDLPACLSELPQYGGGIARVHYHVPLFVQQCGALRSTSGLVREAAPVLFAASDHIEAETYTWQVWKQATGEALPIHEGIARELQWVQQLLHSHTG